MSLLSAFQTPPASPQLRPGSAFSEPNSPPPQESCFCGQIIPYEDDGIYCSRSCAHEATLSSLLKGTVSAGIQSPSPSSIGSSISRPQTPTSQIIQTDVSKVPRAPSRTRTSVKSRSSTYSSAWSNLDESPLISSSLPKFGTSIYDYSSEEEDQVKIVRHGLRKQLRASPNAGKLGQALFGDGSSDSGAQSSSRVGLKGIKEAEGEAADEGQVRGMSSSTIASINLSLRLGLEGAHQSHGADGAALKEETNGEEENFKSAFSNSIRNSSASKSTSLPQRTILERHLSSATSSCPTPLVSQLPYRSSIITQGSGSAGTVNQSSPPLQAQPIWSSYSYSPQFSDVSGSSGSTHDSFWDRSGLELMGSPPRKGSVSDRSGSFSSSAARSRATTVSSQDDTTRVPSDYAEETSQVKSGVSRSSLYDLNQMIQRTFDSFDAFEYDAIDNDGLDSQYSTPLGFEEMKLHPVEDTSPGTSPASPIFDFRTHGSPPLTSSNLLALDMGAQPLPTSFKTVESLRIQPKTHQKSNSAPSSLPRIKHKNSSNMIRASISSPMLIKTSLCPSTLASCRDIQRSVDESTEPVSENSPPVISKSRSSNMRQQWKRFKIYA